MMSHRLCRIKATKVNTRKWKIVEKTSIFKEKIRFMWEKIKVCSSGNFNKYKRLSTQKVSEGLKVVDSEEKNDESDLVALKTSILGDCQIGKTSFVGMNLMDKAFPIEGARIVVKIWDIGGDHGSYDQIPIACKDAVEILFMFDLTSRSTLNNVIDWYIEARKWNKTAIPILIGTKYDDLAQLPLDIQWTVVTQARAYAKAMKATLFFSSATHNINVNKIFKFIISKLFNLPWTVQKNLTIGEPIIDF